MRVRPLGQIEQIESEPCRLFWIGQTLRITDCSELEQSQCVRVRFRGSHLQAPEQYARLLAYIDAHALTPAGFFPRDHNDRLWPDQRP